MNVYRVEYRRHLLSARKYRVTVHAVDADEARAKAQVRDPQLVQVTSTKNRGSVREAVVS
jgi:hypothetical protein